MAISAATVFETRIGGNDANSGGFVAGAAGTDRTLSATPHVTIDGATITATVHTTTTQLNIVGYTVLDPEDVGNTVLIAGGTMTAGLYEITVADEANNRWTLDRSAGVAAQTGTGRMGGCKATPGAALEHHVASNTIWVKYSATTYDISSTSPNVAGGRLSLGLASATVRGYDVTRGDATGNRPTCKATANTMTLCTLGNADTTVRNIIFDAGAATGIVGVTTASNSLVMGVKVKGATTTHSFRINASSTAKQCEAEACAVVGFISLGGTCVDCVVSGGSSDGFEGNAANNVFINCVAETNSGGGSDGFLNNGATANTTCINCVAYNNGQHGFNEAAGSLTCSNCISWDNVGVGFNADCDLYHCAAGSNATDFHADAKQTSCVTLTADPFMDAAGGDFSRNNAVGGGAAVAAVGYPGVLPPLISTTGHSDIGVVQRQGTGMSIHKSAVGRRSF